MSNLEAARHAILDLGSEDYYHLADAAVYLPTVPTDLRRSVAKQALLELIEEGYVQLYFGRMAINDVAKVPTEKVREVLDDARAWEAEPDEKDRVYCFANTDRGDELYFSGATRPPEPPAA